MPARRDGGAGNGGAQVEQLKYYDNEESLALVRELLSLPGCQPEWVNQRTTGERPWACTAFNMG